MEPSIRQSKITPRKLMRSSKSNNNSGEQDSLSKFSTNSSETTINELSEINLAKYCTKDLFYIYLVNENSNSASETVNKLLEVSQDYEDISCVTFIDRKDVLNLLDVANRETFSPGSLKPLLARLIHTIDSSIIPLLTEVQLVKLKLIQIMYQKYVKEVKKNEKERNLETLLNTLTKECRKKHKKEDEAEKAGQPKEIIKKTKKEDKHGKDTDQNEEFDYTTMPLNKDDVTYEENIFNYVWFFCLTGFNNPDIIQGLIEQINVPIEGIIKFYNTKENSKSETEESFWNRIKHDFFDNTSAYKFLERTILLQFIPTSGDNALNSLEELIFMLRKFLNVKLTYLKYIRHLKLNRIKHSYGKMPLECFSSYNRALKNIPPECANSAIILDALLKEISIRNNETRNSTKNNSLESLICTKPTKSVHCMDPLYDLNAFFPQTKYPGKVEKIKSFLTHEENVLLKILKSYKRIGDQVMYTTLNLLKLQKTLLGFEDFPTLNYDISHLHDKNPSEQLDVRKSDDKIENFLFTFIFNKIINEALEPSSPSEEIDVILKNLITFSANEYFKIMQPQHEEDVQSDDENLYNTSVAHFRWKEFLNKDLLFQEIFKASEEYLYTIRKFSPETDNFFLIFSDKLDEFGINTKMYNIILRTPICFRDFCRYITVKDNNWLENNKNEINAETFKVVFKEKCPGVQKVKTQMKIFQEYSYLLDEDINENEIVDEVQEVYHDDELKSQELLIDSKITFEDILNDLKASSSNELNPLNECENAPPEEQLLAYNLGSNIFKLNGKIVTFCSHDGVKVTVDNSRFLQSPEKCTFNLSHNENCVSLHSSQSMLRNPYIIKIKLKDDTRISLISSCAIIQKDNNRTQNNSTINEAEQEIVNVIYNELSEKTGQSEEPELNNVKSEDILQIADPTPVPVVHYIAENQLEELLKGQSFDELSTNEDYDDLIVSLINAAENNGTIYKVYTKNNFLERRNSNFQIPLANALKTIISIDNNFIPKLLNKPYEKFTKRYAPASRTSTANNNNNNNSFDFRICLPNGLYIRPYNCVVDKSTLMIKQEYSEEKPCISSLEHEEFRLYSNEGSVIVKKFDGTITIYKANGDLINFEKPTTNNNNNENNGLNFNNIGTYCHCTTIDDYRNKLNKLLKDQENSDCSTSRRAHITSKQNHILDDKVLKILDEFKVPFVKKSILRFDGKRIKIQGDKITQKQQYHLTSSQDFLTGEIHYERSDDFRSVFYKNGSQKIMFSDGTIISNSIDVAEELVDDFVYIKLNYRYEHPYYATVGFNFDKTVVVELNNDVILEEKPDKCGFRVKIEPDDLQVSISHENAFVKKSCSECLEEFEATFHIKSFKDSIWNPTDEFMQIKDSYNKHFYSDYLGNCSRNNNYIIGALNAKNCNHFKKNQYKKLFIVNKDYRGVKISTNDYVKNKIKQFENNNNNLNKKITTVENYCMMENENITVSDCREKFFNKFSDRFFNIELLKNPINEYYTTFRVFHKMFESVDDIQNHVSNMWEIFFHEKLEQINYPKIYDDVATLANITEAYYIKNKKELLAEAKESSGKRKKYLEENEKKKYNVKCSCVKQIMSMEEKMLQWKKECKKYRKLIRQKNIPPYFKSPFCKNI